MIDLSQIVHEPLYPIAHAAHYLGISAATLTTWVKGRNYETESGTKFSKPLIEIVDSQTASLSFLNLVEAHASGRAD